VTANKYRGFALVATGLASGPLMLAVWTLVGAPPGSQMCTYEASTWSVELRRAVPQGTVRHSYAGLVPEEIDSATGCTVCSEDQDTVRLPPLAPFPVCRLLAATVRRTLAELLASGEPVLEVVGYRVIRSRGGVDAAGHRARFSSHAYGIAIDINPALNGLYDRCVTFGPACRLLRGGAWRPGARGALTANGPIARAMQAAGFRWGGEIAGQQKDFMHFSPTGY